MPGEALSLGVWPSNDQSDIGSMPAMLRDIRHWREPTQGRFAGLAIKTIVISLMKSSTMQRILRTSATRTALSYACDQY